MRSDADRKRRFGEWRILSTTVSGMPRKRTLAYTRSLEARGSRPFPCWRTACSAGNYRGHARADRSARSKRHAEVGSYRGFLEPWPRRPRADSAAAAFCAGNAPRLRFLPHVGRVGRVRRVGRTLSRCHAVPLSRCHDVQRSKSSNTVTPPTNPPSAACRQ